MVADMGLEGLSQEEIEIFVLTGQTFNSEGDVA